MDSASVPMGDRGFLRLNMRLEPEQLPAGEVSRSENGRMDRGSWQPRKAIENLSGVLQSDGDPLELPFFLVDAVGGRDVSPGTVTVSGSVSPSIDGTFTVRTFPDRISFGRLAYEDGGGNLIFWDGAKWTATDNGLAYWESAEDVATPDLVTSWTAVGASGTLAVAYGAVGATRSTVTVTLFVGDHGFNAETFGGGPVPPDADTGQAHLGVEGLTGTVNPNGVHLMTVVDEATLTFTIPGATGSVTYGGTGVVRSVVDDTAAAQIFGSCLFSDPSSDSAEFVIIAAQGEAYKVEIADGSVTAIGYPVGEVLDGPCDLIQHFDRVRLRRDGDRAWDWIAGATDFTEAPSGVFTQPQVFEATGGDVDVVSGLCTVTVIGNTTIAAGDTIQIYGSDEPRFTSFIGRSFVVTAASTTAVSFYIPVEDLSTIATSVLSIGKQVSIGAGFIHEPGAPWGAYHQRRSIVPYRYAVSGDNTTAVFTDRDVRDELVISDILDPDTYDVISNQFRITAGIADFLVAVQPFYEDTALVFMRNSLHGIFGLSGSLADTQVRELTREIGCLARKSVAQHGPDTLFLSDNGVYAVSFVDQYNLRGVDVPLSEAIQPVIDRINADLAGDSVGVFFSNRYFLAVPLDSVAGAGDATGNNAILVFNFLNQGWESVDSVDDSRWNIINFHIGRSGDRNDLYAVNDLGGVHKIDALDSDLDDLALDPGGSVEQVRVSSLLSTRQYDAQTLERKRFTGIQVQAEASTQSCDAILALAVEDADSAVTVGTIESVLGELLAPNEGASLRARTGGQRGHGAILSITPTAGRPKIKSANVEATLTNRSVTNQI